MIPPHVRLDLSERRSNMKVFSRRIVSVCEDPTNELTDTQVAYAAINDELTKRGRFDEQGGYLSDEDWADSQ